MLLAAVAAVRQMVCGMRGVEVHLLSKDIDRSKALDKGNYSFVRDAACLASEAPWWAIDGSSVVFLAFGVIGRTRESFRSEKMRMET